MKRTAITIMVILLIITLVGCSKKEAPKENLEELTEVEDESVAEEPTEIIEEEPEEPIDMATLDDAKVELLSEKHVPWSQAENVIQGYGIYLENPPEDASLFTVSVTLPKDFNPYQYRGIEVMKGESEEKLESVYVGYQNHDSSSYVYLIRVPGNVKPEEIGLNLKSDSGNALKLLAEPVGFENVIEKFGVGSSIIKINSQYYLIYWSAPMDMWENGVYKFGDVFTLVPLEGDFSLLDTKIDVTHPNNNIYEKIGDIEYTGIHNKIEQSFYILYFTEDGKIELNVAKEEMKNSEIIFDGEDAMVKVSTLKE